MNTRTLSALRFHHLSPAKRVGAIAAAGLMYGVILVAIYPLVGGAGLAISLLPVMAIGWLMGLRAGLVAGLLMFPVNALALALVDVADWRGVLFRGLPGHIVLVFLGGLIGWLGELLYKVRDQSEALEQERASLEIQIDQRKTIEKEIATSEKRFRAFFENSPDAIFVESIAGLILDVNPAACALHEMTRAELIGRNIMDLVPEGQRETFAEDFAKLAAGEMARAEGFSYTKGGREIPVEILVSGIDYAGEHSLLLHVRDTTQQRKVQEALAVAFDQALEVSRLKGELLATVSHELRTPLNAIMGFAEILGLGVYGSLSDEQLSAIRQISASTEELLNMVNQLLDQAQIEAGRLRLNIASFSIHDIIERVQVKMQALADAKGLQLISKIDPALPQKISGDSARINQIIINLVSNAIKFTETGQITLYAHKKDDAHWMLEVSDTGSGIPLDIQEAIFEPFRLADSSATRIYRGSGLGLSIVRELTHLMGGDIRLTSEVGRGTTFFITMPFNPGK